MARVIPPLPADGGNVGTWGPILNTAIDYLQDKSLMVVNVTDYPGVQDSASVSSQTGLEEAVTDAIALGAVLHFPAGQYLAATNIPNLHVVRKSGPGRIVTGSSTFYVAPAAGQVNTLFVRATGVDTNDGLTATRPLREIRKAFELLAAYGPLLGGSWIVDVRAGTYKGGITVPVTRGLGSQDFIKVTDPTANVHPTIPTALVAKSADTAATYGIQATDGVALRVEGLKFTGAFAQAVDLRRNSYLHWVNNHVDGAVVGLQLTSHCRYNMVGGIIANCTSVGVAEVFGVVRAYNATAVSVAEGTIIRNAPIGLQAKENCSGHLDWLTVEDCQQGVQLQAWSTGNVDNLTLKRNGIGIVLVNGEVHEDASVLWGAGADVNTRRLLALGSSSELSAFGWTGSAAAQRTGHRPLVVVASNYTDTTVTGVTTETTVFTFAAAVKADRHSVKGKKLRVEVAGSVGGTALTAAFRVLLNVAGTYVTDVTLPLGMVAGGDFLAVFDVTCDVDGASQKALGRVTGAGASDATYAARAMDLTGADRSVVVSVIPGATADSVTLRYGEVWG